MFKEKLAKLIDLKSIITIITTVGALYGYIADKLTNEQFFELVIMVYMFYFNKKDKESEGEKL